MSKRENIINIGIIGAGAGADALLEILVDHQEVKIVGLAYRSPDRPAVVEAGNRGIPLFTDFRELAELAGVHLLIDTSGEEEVERYLLDEKKSNSEVICCYSGWFLWKMIEEHKKRKEEMTRSLAEQEVLYSAGVMLASAANTEQTLNLIMESALSLTGMAAGTLALYDEERGTMQIKVSMGFEGLTTPVNHEWEVRQGGLTGHILSNDRPTVIEDLALEKTFDTSSLLKLGVRALIATPLRVEGKIVGILYVDDFSPRSFTEREINTLNLLGVQAAAALDKALLLEQAELMAVTDELTKLYNHRYFVRALEQEIRRASRYGYRVSLCMVDVDYFKHFNDTYGHLQGNVVLTKVAKILGHTARDTDIVARYGGEEFSIILVQADDDQAAYVAERIRHEVETHPFPGESRQPGGRLTISVGVSSYPIDALEPVDLIEAADKALYHSKSAGRNLVTAYRDIRDRAELYPISEKHRYHH